MTIEEFKEITRPDKLKCIFCNSKELLKIIEHEYKHEGAMLKFAYYCESCNITISGHVY